MLTFIFRLLFFGGRNGQMRTLPLELCPSLDTVDIGTFLSLKINKKFAVSELQLGKQKLDAGLRYGEDIESDLVFYYK